MALILVGLENLHLIHLGLYGSHDVYLVNFVERPQELENLRRIAVHFDVYIDNLMQNLLVYKVLLNDRGRSGILRSLLLLRLQHGIKALLLIIPIFLKLFELLGLNLLEVCPAEHLNLLELGALDFIKICLGQQGLLVVRAVNLPQYHVDALQNGADDFHIL